MNDLYYYQYILFTLKNSFNFRGKAGRTEYAFFILFFISYYILLLPLTILFLGNPSDIMEGKVSYNPIILTVYNCFSYFSLFITFSAISLTFRRCRDIGHTVLVLIPSIALVIFVIGVLDFLEVIRIEDTGRFSLLWYLSLIILFVFPFLLIFVKGRERPSNITEKSRVSFKHGKNRHSVFAVVTMTFIVSLCVFHFNYEYTKWWIDEWILICCAIASFLAIIAFCYIISRKLFRH